VVAATYFCSYEMVGPDMGADTDLRSQAINWYHAIKNRETKNAVKRDLANRDNLTRPLG
jgi:hypothetical protein